MKKNESNARQMFGRREFLAGAAAVAAAKGGPALAKWIAEQDKAAD